MTDNDHEQARNTLKIIQRPKNIILCDLLRISYKQPENPEIGDQIQGVKFLKNVWLKLGFYYFMFFIDLQIITSAIK